MGHSRVWMREAGAVAAATAALLGCSPWIAQAHDQPVTITIWEGSPPGVSVSRLIQAFERANPTIRIKWVTQPGENYFSLLHTANLTHRGPDIESIWTGYYVLQNAPYLVKLNRYLPLWEQKRLFELQYSSANYNVKDGIYIAPVETQLYIGVYNKALFRKAGITAMPTDWAQLYAACAKLKRIGVIPITFGNESLGLSAEFYPAFDLGYLLAGVLSPQQWPEVYDGKIPWTSPLIVSQLQKWHELYVKGFTNRNVLTNTNPYGQIEKGQAAIYTEGSWITKTFAKALGANEGLWIPPYNPTPKHDIVLMSGYGFGVTNYSKHIPQALKFVEFVDSPAGQRIIGERHIPALAGIPVAPSATLHAQMVSLVEKDHYTVYPFIDNILQPAVFATAEKVIPAVLAGQMTPQAAASDLQQTLESLPPSERTFGNGS